jgi:hypothetical protein
LRLSAADQRPGGIVNMAIGGEDFAFEMWASTFCIKF